MDSSQFDDFIRNLAGSRRSLLSGGLALVAGWLGVSAAKAKKKHKKRKTKQRAAEPNAFGCIDVGEFCQSATQCCSGICEGKKGRQTCRAHDVGNCAAGAQPGECGGAEVACTTSAGAPGICGTTTGNAGFCGTYTECYFCTTDLDCQLAVGGVLGPRAACVQCAECSQTDGTACVSRDYIG
jgi:hypothetical protein